MGETCAIMTGETSEFRQMSELDQYRPQFEIQAAEDVIAVAFARVALLNISTGI